MQTRRDFLGTISLGSAGLTLPLGGLFTTSHSFAAGIDGSDYDTLTKDLLTDWCDGMLAHQISDPSDPVRHGALACPSCDFIHGRCWEALYRFMHMAKTTGEKKYLDAAVKLTEGLSLPGASGPVVPAPGTGSVMYIQLTRGS